MSRASEYAAAVSNLYAQQGRVRGQAQTQSGQIWGSTIAKLGDFAGQALTQYAQQKAANKEEQAIRDLFTSDTVPDAQTILRRIGPQKGVPIINALAALKTDAQGDPKLEAELLSRVAKGLDVLPEDQRAAVYPMIVQNYPPAKRLLDAGKIRPDYDETFWKFVMGTDAKDAPKQGTRAVKTTEGGVTGTKIVPDVPGGFYPEPTETPKPPASLDALKIDAANPNSPTRQQSAEILKNLPAAGDKPETRSLDVQAADALARGDLESYRRLLKVKKEMGQADDRPTGTANPQDREDAEAIADAIIAGEQPPELTGLYGKGAAVRAALARKGYNQAQALTDWRATQKHVATLNGAQQTRMGQAIDNAAHSLDVIEELANQWDGGKFPVLNKGRLIAATNGTLGPKAQQIATQLKAQIADVTSELANVYMGGNSPTDHALDLAAKNLSADWTRDQLKSAIELSRRNLKIRANSMRNVGVAGASVGNPYAAPPAVEQWERGPDGKLRKVTK